MSDKIGKRVMERNNETIICISTALEFRDRQLLEHSMHTAHIAQCIAKILIADGFRHALPTCEDILRIGIVHDVGKLNIPDAVLMKSRGLTKRETETVRFHPTWGAEFVSKVPSLKHLAVYVHQHHEEPNGNGYPLGLKIDDIRPASRLINVCDRFSAMTMDRPYRRSIAPSHVIGILEKDIEVFFGRRNKKAIIQCLLSIQQIQYIARDEDTHPFIKQSIHKISAGV